MSKSEYLDRLEGLLMGISAEERCAAMEYYRDYLEDAGPDGEVQAMEHLGSPETVAAAIKDGLQGDKASGYTTESGYRSGHEADSRFAAASPSVSETESRNTEKSTVNPDNRPVEKEKKKHLAAGWIILIVFGIIVFGIPALSVGGAVLMTVLAVLAAFCLGGFAVFLGLLIAGIVMLVVGVAKIILLPGLGVMLAGGGLLCLTFALLALLAAVWIIGRFIPWLIRGIVALFQKLFGIRRRD